MRTALAVTLFLAPLTAAAPPSDADVVAWVDRRVADWQPTADERRFDHIGWADDLRHALRLAKEHSRPVLYFSHDGRMGIGRC